MTARIGLFSPKRVRTRTCRAAGTAIGTPIGVIGALIGGRGPPIGGTGPATGGTGPATGRDDPAFLATLMTTTTRTTTRRTPARPINTTMAPMPGF
ncbi:hypothetical protein GCM10023196_079060 [Actinoallomurus vinaceus]|uniref:Uncharacterized protein n=1 Tax=Actinoallomurus vinaceus TaxID=1080074 RepID=A0ABP8UM75_9ACTN